MWKLWWRFWERLETWKWDNGGPFENRGLWPVLESRKFGVWMPAWPRRIPWVHQCHSKIWLRNFGRQRRRFWRMSRNRHEYSTINRQLHFWLLSRRYHEMCHYWQFCQQLPTQIDKCGSRFKNLPMVSRYRMSVRVVILGSKLQVLKILEDFYLDLECQGHLECQGSLYRPQWTIWQSAKA